MITAPKQRPDRSHARRAIMAVLHHAEQRHHRVAFLVTLGDYTQQPLNPRRGYDANVVITQCQIEHDDPYTWLQRQLPSTVDDGQPEHFTVMAGIGMDAVIMEETDDTLKDKIGAAAYFVAAGKAVGRLPIRLTVQLDDHRPVKRHAMLCVIGNVSDLRGNLTLIPGAKPDDGLLDLYIASPHRLRHWLKLALRLITRRPKKDDQVEQHTGKRVKIRIDGVDNYQLDGDVIGECTTLIAEIEPGALTICVPPAGDQLG